MMDRANSLRVGLGDAQDGPQPDSWYVRMVEETDSGQPNVIDTPIGERKVTMHWENIVENPRLLEVYLFYVAKDHRYEVVLLWERDSDDI